MTTNFSVKEAIDVMSHPLFLTSLILLFLLISFLRKGWINWRRAFFVLTVPLVLLTLIVSLSQAMLYNSNPFDFGFIFIFFKPSFMVFVALLLFIMLMRITATTSDEIYRALFCVAVLFFVIGELWWAGMFYGLQEDPDRVSQTSDRQLAELP